MNSLTSGCTTTPHHLLPTPLTYLQLELEEYFLNQEVVGKNEEKEFQLVEQEDTVAALP